MAYSVATLRDLNVLGAGAAATDGIGTMTEDRWQKLAAFMVEAGMIKLDKDWRQAYTNAFAKDLHITL